MRRRGAQRVRSPCGVSNVISIRLSQLDYLVEYDNGDIEWLSGSDKWPGPDPVTGQIIMKAADFRYVKVIKINA